MIEKKIKKILFLILTLSQFYPYDKIIYADSSKENKMNDEYRQTKTPLELAVDENDFIAAKKLIEKGANVNVESYYKFKPFKYRNYKQSFLRKLVQLDVDTIDFEKMSPLHRAITHNNFDLVKLLISKNANLKSSAHFGGYPLDFALELGYYDIAEYLLRKNADSIFKDKYLNLAVNQGNIKIAELLLKIEANPNYIYMEGAALHKASKKNMYDMVKLLLKYKADKSLKDDNGKTPAELTKDSRIKEML